MQLYIQYTTVLQSKQFFLSCTFILNVSEFVYLPSMTFSSFTTLVEEVDTTFVEIHKKLLLNLSAQIF